MRVLAGLVGQREGLATSINTGTIKRGNSPAYSMSQLNNADQEDLLNRFMSLRYGLAQPARKQWLSRVLAASLEDL